MFLIFDTETTGLPRDWNAPITDIDNWPRLVQLAWQVHDAEGKLVDVKNFIVKPEGFNIPFNSEQIHGISTERAHKEGVSLQFVLDEFNAALETCEFIAGHNVGFDVNIMGAEYIRKETETKVAELKVVDTKDEGTDYCAIPGGKGGKFKWPTLTELHQKLFGEGFDEAHNASADVEATTRCFLELIRIGVITPQRLGFDDQFIQRFREENPETIQLIGLNIQPYKPLDEVAEEEQSQPTEETTVDVPVASDTGVTAQGFVHLHAHSQFSILQATSDVKELVARAKELEMPAVALTDHGNMMGAFQFVGSALKEGIKPIVGCEFFVCKDRNNKTQKDNGYQVVLLAKNKNGYRNLCKLSSLSYIEGFYYVPRIDKDLILEYKEDLIALSGGIRGEVPDLILNVGEQVAEEAFLWWKEEFGEDFYVELNRHGQKEDKPVNDALLGLCAKHSVKYIAANNCYYLDKDEANAHDILLCVKDGELKETPIGRGRGFRFGFPNDEFYFKTPAEMQQLFADLPDALNNTLEIADKIEEFKLSRDVLLPAFPLPEEFKNAQDDEDNGKRGENAFLRHLAYEGAAKRYEEITEEVKERLDFELETIAKTGYPGYFLLVQEITSKAREMGVSVGPGRGSAAGSLIAYVTGITNVDPIKYDLLFERFLNPDRISLPDIDIDFDDEGRGDLINWVVETYGFNQVAQIITYGTMAAKSSIRDTARVLNLPLPDADRLAKLVPDIKLNKLFKADDKTLKDKLNADQLQMAQELKTIAGGSDLSAQTVNQALVLEGSVRNTGIHACGVIITPSDITEIVPVAVAKDADLLVTQFDNAVVESAGLLKMDFLGLKTLTIIKDACKLIKERHGVEIDPDEIPLDDEKTYELYQRGDTNGTFQFESDGMQKHLRSLKPDKFADLIAMNALYRPGPLEYIPNFIARKHGREEISYDHDLMKEYLEETYGITVYQEQVMLLSQKLAGFTKGEADTLRKAMGKKKRDILDSMKPQFIAGCAEKDIDGKTAEKIWRDWEAFAAYAFNKSHSTCYSLVAFHTAYLKAHYPAEYMAAVLTHNMNDIKKVTFFMEECKRMGVKVLGPSVNESARNFRVNDEGKIRFGLGALKGVGGAAVDSIVTERAENGRYASVLDFMQRVDLRNVNRKTIESLALGGSFDDFENMHRAQFFHETGDGTVLEKLVKFGARFQESKDAPPDLFGDVAAVEISAPAVPEVEPWSTLEALSKEKEVVGFYISGHPLDDYKVEINNFCNITLDRLQDLEKLRNREIRFAGIISSAEHRISKNGNPYGKLSLEGYNDSADFFLFSDDYVKFKDYLVNGWFIYVVGKVTPKKWREDELEVKISNIELLTDVRSKLAKKLTIHMDAARINQQIVEQLDEILQSDKGECNVQFQLVDREEEVQVGLQSRSRRVELTDDLLKELESIEGVGFRLSSTA